MSAIYEKANRIFNIDSELFLRSYGRDLGVAGLAVIAAALFCFLAWLSGDYALSDNKHPFMMLVGALGCLLALGCTWLTCRIVHIETIEGFRQRWYNAKHYGSWDYSERQPKPVAI